MSETPPIVARYDGEGAFQALGRFAAECDRHFVIGQKYQLAELEERSSKTHKHFFATVGDAWSTLPEGLAERWPHPTILRKFCLIKAGFCTQADHVCGSKAEALRLTGFLAAQFSDPDAYRLVSVTRNVVNVWTPHSQSLRSMDKATFQASKEGVFAVLAELLGTTAETLAEHERRLAA